MECDLTLSGIDVVIADGGQDANPSNSEESSTTSSTVNTPIENVNRTFAKSLTNNGQNNGQSDQSNSSELNKQPEERISHSDSSQGNKSDAKSLVSNSSQSTLTDGGVDTNPKESNKDLLSSLPWNSAKRIASSLPIDKTIRPGEFVLRALFSEFALLAEKKIDAVLSQEAAEKPLNKLLQRGEDPIFDQLLSGIVRSIEFIHDSISQTREALKLNAPFLLRFSCSVRIGRRALSTFATQDPVRLV